MTIAAIRTALEQALAALTAYEAGGHPGEPPAQPDLGAPLPTMPPLPPLPRANSGPRNGWDACSSMIAIASREGWPGHAGRPFDRFDYVRGIEGLYVGADRREAPIYENQPDQCEADIRDLCRSDKGRAWLADPENRARTSAFYVRLAGFKPVERLPDNTLREYD